MLGAHRCLDVDDGSCIYIDPALQVVWPDGVVLFTAARRLRSIYPDQQRVLRADDAAELTDAGLAAAVGGRLFEQPDLSRRLFDWDATSEIDFIATQLGPSAQGALGIEFGCGTGRILLALLDRGLRVDGVDAAEPTVRWLANLLHDRGDETSRACRLTVADLSACAFPGAYGYAIAGLNTLRYLPSVASLRRHLHLAALSVRSGGRYVIHVDSWIDGATRSQEGVVEEWLTSTGDQELRVTWSKLRSDPAAKIDLERVQVHCGEDIVLDEHQTQLALSVDEWRALATERSEWDVLSIYFDSLPEPVRVNEHSIPASGNFWLVLERTGHTAAPIFTR